MNNCKCEFRMLCVLLCTLAHCCVIFRGCQASMFFSSVILLISCSLYEPNISVLHPLLHSLPLVVTSCFLDGLLNTVISFPACLSSRMVSQVQITQQNHRFWDLPWLKRLPWWWMIPLDAEKALHWLPHVYTLWLLLQVFHVSWMYDSWNGKKINFLLTAVFYDTKLIKCLKCLTVACVSLF